MSVGPIPWSSIDRYAARFGFDAADEFERFAKLIRMMDGAFLAHANEMTKKPEKRR